MLKRLGLMSNSLGGLLLLGVGFLATIVVASFWLASRTDTLSMELASHQELVGALPRTLTMLQDMETGQRGFLITNDPAYLEPYEEGLARVEGIRADLRRLVPADPKNKDRLSGLITVMDAKVAELTRTVELARSGQRADALARLRTGVGKKLMDEARDTLDDMIVEGNALIAHDRDMIRQNATATVWVTAIGAILVMIVGAISLFLIRRVSRQQERARAVIEELNVGLEARVAERTVALTRANEEVQRFAYIVSHDLRAPLVNIVGFSSELDTGVETLRDFLGSLPEGAVPPAKLREARLAVEQDIPEAVGFIRASTTKMDKLINAILHLSRQGRRELQAQRVDLNELVARSFAALKHQVDETEAVVVVQPALPSLVSDRLALEQIMGNLIDNALKYRMAGRAPKLQISCRRQGKFVQLELADNGRGIAPQDHERVFELFRRAGKQDVAGEGMGLSHVRALARRLGGDITVKSTLGEGSRFLVTIPLVFTPEDQAKNTP